jgi:hypothetical protein
VPLHKNLKVNGELIGRFKLLYFEFDDKKREIKLYDPMRDGSEVLVEQDQIIVQVTNKQYFNVYFAFSVR